MRSGERLAMIGRRLLTMAFSLGVYATAAAQDGECRTLCMPDEVLDEGSGCCVRATGTIVVQDETAATCVRGQVLQPGTNVCCWPGQVHAGGSCRGIPSSCPTGFSVEAEACVLSECTEGRARAGDGVTCCWSGQAVSEGVCRGVPDHCPVNYELRGEDCSGEAHEIAMAQQSVETAAAEDRAATIAAARAAGGFDSGFGFLAALGYQTAIPGVFENAAPYYMGPRLGLFELAGPLEFHPSLGLSFDPDSALLVFDFRGELGVHLLSFPNTTTSAVSIINISLGVFVEIWAGEALPDDGVFFGGAYIANTAYFDCGVGLRIQYNQTVLGTYGPIQPSAALSLVFGAREVDDPGDHQCASF